LYVCKKYKCLPLNFVVTLLFENILKPEAPKHTEAVTGG
jgi:hypothetical protein